MNIYHYDKYEYFYTGKTVATDIPGYGFQLPADSTDIPPPLEQCKSDEIPIFRNNKWQIVKNIFQKTKIVEWNYDAGRSFTTYAHFSISHYDFPPYPSLPMLLNPVVATLSICQKIKMIQTIFDNIISIHKDIRKRSLAGPNLTQNTTLPFEIHREKFEIESMIYFMRRVLDSLVQLTCLLTNYQQIIQKNKIPFNEIGKFTDVNLPNSDIKQIICGNDIDYEEDHTNFLNIINHLFNSFKHSLIHEESYSLYCKETPSVVSFQFKNNDFNKEAIYHNHNIYHIMMGFQDNLLRIIKNQHIYLKNKKPNFIKESS